ncbi:MAG: type II toxin-antitoxin system ParD family antitoxin [Deinococcota bacterium]
MKLSLTPKQEAIVKAQLASGRFTDLEDMIDKALNLLEDESELLDFRKMLANTEKTYSDDTNEEEALRIANEAIAWARRT